MKVRSVRRDAAGKRQDFNVAVQLDRRIGTCEAKLRDGEAADAAEHERGTRAARRDRGFDGAPQIVAGGEAKRQQR